MHRCMHRERNSARKAKGDLGRDVEGRKEGGKEHLVDDGR